ncbi:hypothetical protein HN873_041111 [Arachis hypogaea]
MNPTTQLLQLCFCFYCMNNIESLQYTQVNAEEFSLSLLSFKCLRKKPHVISGESETSMEKANEQQERATIMDTIEQVFIALENLIH